MSNPRLSKSRAKMKKMQTDGKSPSSQEGKTPLQVFSIDNGEPRGALAAEPPLLPTDDLLRELQADSERLEQSTPQEILRWAVDRFAPKFTMATAFGPESKLPV